MKLKPYPEYKDSGVEWIREIPDDWETHRFKINFKYIKVKIPENLQEEARDNSLPYLSMDFLRGKESETLYSDSDPKAVKIEKGDLLLLWDGANAGEFLEGKKGYLSSTMVKLLIENIDPDFSKYICKSFEPLLRDLTIGMGIPHVNGDILGNIRITHPTFQEQKKIVSFLDRKTSEIDLTIEKDTRLIELLQEKRTALINHVVTKGLDPEAPMKDSMVEWIGEIPEGWETPRMRYLLKNGIEGIKIGPFGSMIKYEELVEEGYKVYGQENIIKTDFSRGSRYLTETKFKELIKYQIFSEDLLITMMGTTGKAQIVPDDIKEGIMDSHLIRLRFNQNILPRFAEILINSSSYIFGEIMYFGKGAIMHGLNSGIIKNLILAVPSVPEQAEILDYLEKETSKIDLTIHKIQNNIGLLHEYKKSLIQHVVTGKVDVRDVV